MRADILISAIILLSLQVIILWILGKIPICGLALVDDRDIRKVEEQYDKPLDDDNSVSITYRIKTVSGQIKWVNEKRCLYAEDSGQSILLSIVKDLQTEDEESYNKEEAIAGYGILFDQNPNPMWIYEISSLRFLKVNAVAIKTYGYSEAEFLTMTIQDIRPKDDQDSLDSFLKTKALLNLTSGATVTRESGGI